MQRMHYTLWSFSNTLVPADKSSFIDVRVGTILRLVKEWKRSKH